MFSFFKFRLSFSNFFSLLLLFLNVSKKSHLFNYFLNRLYPTSNRHLRTRHDPRLREQTIESLHSPLFLKSLPTSARNLHEKTTVLAHSRRQTHRPDIQCELRPSGRYKSKRRDFKRFDHPSSCFRALIAISRIK